MIKLFKALFNYFFPKYPVPHGPGDMEFRRALEITDYWRRRNQDISRFKKLCSEIPIDYSEGPYDKLHVFDDSKYYWNRSW